MDLGLDVSKTVRKPRLTAILILIIVSSIIAFKLANEPYIFDPHYGAQSVYGFTVSDTQEPFTVFYLTTGANVTSASGDIQVSNQTLQIQGNSSASAEWSFDLEQFIQIVKQNKGEINQAALLFAKPDPLSQSENASLSFYINDQFIANVPLSTPINSTYTWKIDTQWDIPGSNFAYPYNFAVLPISNDTFQADSSSYRQTMIRVVASKGVQWNIDYVAIKLFSDPYALKLPWWRQNSLLLVAIFSSVFFSVFAAIIIVLRFSKKSLQLPKIAAIKMWVTSNRFILLCIGLGLLLRLVLMMEFPLGSGDQYTYRFISLASYYYGIDTRSFYGIYGTVWHGLLLLSYPISILLHPSASSISTEYVALKLPVIASDVLIGLLLYRIGSKLSSKKISRTLLVFWLFNPFVLWLSPIWGTHHIVSTMLSVLAVERAVSGHNKSSALALSAAVFSGLNNIFLLPVFAILVFKSLGKPKFLEFMGFFVLGCSILALPWNFSTAIFFNTYSGAGRVGFATLSYSAFLVPYWLASLWSVLTLAVGIIVLSVYLLRKNEPISNINNYILTVLLIFFLTNTLVFPTYALWSLPFLLFAYVSARKVPFSYVVFFMSFPLLWILYWSPPILPQFLSAPGTQVFRETFGLDFSLICLFILVKLNSPRNDSQATPLWTNKHTSRLKSIIETYVPSLTLILIVFAPWIKEPFWLALWNNMLRPSLTVFSVALILITIVMNWRRSTLSGEKNHVRKASKCQHFAAAAMTSLLAYNIIILVFSQILPVATNSSPFFLTSSDDLYFSLMLVLLLPSVIWGIMRNRRSLSFVTLITILQIDYIITRHYSTYVVTNLILFTYMIMDARLFILDLLTVALTMAFLVLALFYQSRNHPRMKGGKEWERDIPESQ